jgi:hypothetical protein
VRPLWAHADELIAKKSRGEIEGLRSSQSR